MHKASGVDHWSFAAGAAHFSSPLAGHGLTLARRQSREGGREKKESHIQCQATHSLGVWPMALEKSRVGHSAATSSDSRVAQEIMTQLVRIPGASADGVADEVEQPRRRTKRVKVLNFTAAGTWEEEEETPRRHCQNQL